MLSVAYGLVNKVPGIKFTIFATIKTEDSFLRRENLNSHPSHLAQRLTFLLNIFVGPSKHFNNGSFLTILIIGGLVDSRMTPDKLLRINN